ncbi:unnamed protein product [Urochloa decumbens]|uniref:Bifunctional inhibitor/plant lipid transfer protein/seed storage helical domain-containing protein n=1 Tax=Urochloa decumbens TaxID=240449 RepID=A0ABC9B6V9_9POAL
MYYGKLAFVILLVLAVASPDIVTGTLPICHNLQKLKSLIQCRAFTERGSFIPAVSPRSPGCKEVRKVPNRDMTCVVLILTDKEKHEHNIAKILALESICKLYSPANQNKVKLLIADDLMLSIIIS